MNIYEHEKHEKRTFRLPNKPLPFVVVILLIVLALVIISLLPTLLVLTHQQ